MRPLRLLLLTASLSLLISSCSDKSSPDAELRAAEAAIANGDMTAASAVAQRLTDHHNLSGLSARQLGRLSIVYMQIADSLDSGTVASATDAYRRAYRQNPDSARAFYSSLPADKAQYSMMLSAIVDNQDNPYDHIHDSEATDSIKSE